LNSKIHREHFSIFEKHFSIFEKASRDFWSVFFVERYCFGPMCKGLSSPPLNNFAGSPNFHGSRTYTEITYLDICKNVKVRYLSAFSCSMTKTNYERCFKVKTPWNDPFKVGLQHSRDEYYCLIGLSWRILDIETIDAEMMSKLRKLTSQDHVLTDSRGVFFVRVGVVTPLTTWILIIVLKSVTGIQVG